jgi:hypothetical protein
MMRVVRKRALKLPEIRLSKEFWTEVGGLVAAGIVTNVIMQRKGEQSSNRAIVVSRGGRLKMNKKSTRDRKAAEGKPLMSLVDEEHRFVRSGGSSFKVVRYLRSGRIMGAVVGVVVGPATRELRELIGHVAQRGYVGYIGLHSSVKKAIGVALRLELKRYLRKVESSHKRRTG